MGKNLFNKVWDLHKAAELPTGQDQLFIGLHLVHEVTSPQAFAMIRERGLTVPYPHRTFATVDHIVPTENLERPFQDSLAEKMMQAIEKNTEAFGIEFYGMNTDYQGIVHIIGPELGLTQPGMTIACGDSHTATHGAFGAIAFGIGTSQIRDVLATQTLAMDRLKVRRIHFTGDLPAGLTAKDMVLKLMQVLGVQGGLGHAYEYAGSAIGKLSMEERMTICNMSIEGGARCGYVNPDQTTYDYLKGRKFAPSPDAWDSAVAFWESMKSDADATFDDEVEIPVHDLNPMVTWGINPGQAVEITEKLPKISDLPNAEREVAQKAYEHMEFSPGDSMLGKKIDVAFIGSCTNGRISDLRAAAKIAKGNRVASGVKAIVVPGSRLVKKEAEAEGLHEIFMEAGFEWREAGCSMCLAMNPDKLQGRQLSASSSNRNFIGRQGSPEGRTLLMSPDMVAAAACAGEVTDVRKV